MWDCFICCNFQAALRSLSNSVVLSFKNLKEQLQRGIKCLITASDSKGEYGEGPEMYRMVFKQKGPVCLRRMTGEKAQDLQGVTQNSSITCFWQMLILRGSRWLQLQSQLFWKLFTSKTVLWPHCTGQHDLECCTTHGSSRMHLRALRVGIRAALSGPGLTLYRDLDISSP